MLLHDIHPETNKPRVTNDGLEASQHQDSGVTFDH